MDGGNKKIADTDVNSYDGMEVTDVFLVHGTDCQTYGIGLDLWAGKIRHLASVCILMLWNICTCKNKAPASFQLQSSLVCVSVSSIQNTR